MVRSILWRLIGCLCFWWSLGLALFFISFGVNRIEKAVQNSTNPERILSDQRPDRNTDAEFQDSVRAMENTGMGQSAAVQVSENSSIRAEKTIAAKVALTFDDGPSPRCTPQLLDGLRELGAKATFFVVGCQAVKDPDIVRRIADEGHQVGNHSYDHAALDRLTPAQALADLEKNDALLRELLGDGDYWVRPPYGLLTDDEAARLTVPLINWSVDTEDWRTKDCDKILDVIYRCTGDGDIVLLHDRYLNTVDAALKAVAHLQQQGYVFVTVSELLALKNVTPEPGVTYRSAP